MIEQEIINICNSKVDRAKLRAPTHTLCVDGTSASRKSSILARTERLVTKVQRHSHSLNIDTLFPACIGYIASGINSQNCEGPHYNDRSFLNCLEWSVLWKVMNDYVAMVGNVRPNANDPVHRALLEKYKKIFAALRDSYFYSYFRKRINAIAFVDSDVERCDELRAQRNLGSDAVRSTWLFYTPLQNLMYITLYPDTHIDMAWFNATKDTVSAALSTWLNDLLQDIVSQVQGSLAPVPMCRFKLPVIEYDYNLINITTHAYRSIGRIGCKRIAYPDQRHSLSSMVPSYVNVSCSSQTMDEDDDDAMTIVSSHDDIAALDPSSMLLMRQNGNDHEHCSNETRTSDDSSCSFDDVEMFS